MHLFFTEEQYARLRRRARKNGTTITQFVRETVVGRLTVLEEEDRLSELGDDQPTRQSKAVGLGIESMPKRRVDTSPKQSPPPPKPDLDRLARFVEGGADDGERAQRLAFATETIAALHPTDADALTRQLSERVKPKQDAAGWRALLPNLGDYKF